MYEIKLGQTFNLANAPTLLEFLRDPLTYDDRIIGGTETHIEKYPYQCSFIGNKQFFCGCFIVSENYILTAGHCAQNLNASGVDLRVGSSSRKNGTQVPISEVIPHENYDSPRFDNDIAVLKTAEPLTFNEFVQPISLPPMGRAMRGGTNVTITGWGRTEGRIPENLMEVTIPVVYYAACYLSYFEVLTRNMWCGGNYLMGGAGTCQGDSGGTAVQDGMAVGVVSFGRGCGQPLAPSVFADIASPPIREFINKHTGL